MKLELKGITKRFGPLVANNDINLTIEEGHIHALLGENGAGKSTLMNVLYGLHQPDEGEILIDGKPVHFNGPGDAVAAGIGMVHQHFMLIPVFTVAESIALGFEPTKASGLIDLAQARKTVKEVSARFGFDLDPDALIEDLSVGAQQRVEIVKALSRQAKVLILDEPTAVLTPQETDELMAIMRQLAEAGTSIVFITHKLREVRAVADEITVIRRGAVVGEASPQDSESELANKMVGRSVMMRVQKAPAAPTGGGLEFKAISMLSPQGVPLLDHVSFAVERGEIVAVAGVQGNGQTELAQTVLGLCTPDSGEILLEGEDISHAGPRKSLDAGVGFIPEDRSTDGIISTFSIAENLILDQYKDSSFASGPMLKLGAIAQNARDKEQEFDIRLTSINDPISSLSGGNQQKVMIGRWLATKPKVLILDEPTRGIDVGAKSEIYAIMNNLVKTGVSIIMISSELPEIINMSDRVYVMAGGVVRGCISREEISQESIMHLAAI